MPILQKLPPVHQTHAVKILAAMARVDRLRGELREACADLEAALREGQEAA